MKNLLIALAAIPMLAGCTFGNVNSAGSKTVAVTPSSQVTTLAEANQSAKLVTDAAKLYVDNGKPSDATLKTIKKLSDAVHSALTDLKTAQANGQNLTFETFNAAVAAFNAYNASNK